MQLKQDLHIPPWLIDTILRIEEQPWNKKLQLAICGVRNLGKTTGVLQIFRHLASKQRTNHNKVRVLHIGLIRSSYRDFNQIVKTFCEWYPIVDTYDAVNREREFGFAYKDIHKAPQLIVFEKTPDLLSLILGEQEQWDGTYIKIIITGFSYNKPDADNHMRGENLGCGWANESQTLQEKPVSTLIGSYGRPSGKVVNPVLIQDFNLPESKDKGYDRLKTLLQYNKSADPEHQIDIYFADIPAPFTFERDPEGDFTFEGHKGFLRENPEFVQNAPPGVTTAIYDEYKTLGDDEVRRNILGLFGRKTKGSIIYNEFEAERHMRDVPLPNADDHTNHLILAGLDFGIRPGVFLGYEQHGTLMNFKDFAIEEINFYELLTGYLIPYFEKHLPHFYKHDQIVFIGDPTSGARRDQMKFATPINVLLGITDINGDEDGDGERFYFPRTVPSPCGNNLEHRLNVSKQMLTRQNGVFFGPECTMARAMFEEEYVEGPNGKPVKKFNNLYHAIADAFQYQCAYLYSDMPTQIEPNKPRKSNNRRRRGKKYV